MSRYFEKSRPGCCSPLPKTGLCLYSLRRSKSMIEFVTRFSKPFYLPVESPASLCCYCWQIVAALSISFAGLGPLLNLLHWSPSGQYSKFISQLNLSLFDDFSCTDVVWVPFWTDFGPHFRSSTCYLPAKPHFESCWNFDSNQPSFLTEMH